jgi:hypothetical protein
MKVLIGYSIDCGRSGDIDGLFVCEQEDLYKLLDTEIYLGEVLGKHSQVSIKFKSLDDLDIKSNDQDFIAKLLDLFPGETLSGFNPFHYLREESDE